ncbi:MAG TPA: hypothetical protein V6D50_07570 [Chroococcales cyanobacterium]
MSQQQVEILMVEHTQTLERIGRLLGHIKELLNLIAELLEQQQHLKQQPDIGEKPTCCYECEKQQRIPRGSELFDLN